MLQNLAVSLLALGTPVLCHGGGMYYDISGVNYTGSWETVRDYQKGSIQRVWSWDAMSPSDPDIACGNPGTPLNVSHHAPVRAGETISVTYLNWPHSHGPMLAYLAACPDEGCESLDLRQRMWFKIWQAGLLNGGLLQGNWAIAAIVGEDELQISIPASIKPGRYLLKHDMVNLEGGPVQMFPNCVQLDIRGEGMASPKIEELVAFPGGYDKDAGNAVGRVRVTEPSGFIWSMPMILIIPCQALQFGRDDVRREQETNWDDDAWLFCPCCQPLSDLEILAMRQSENLFADDLRNESHMNAAGRSTMHPFRDIRSAAYARKRSRKYPQNGPRTRSVGGRKWEKAERRNTNKRGKRDRLRQELSMNQGRVPIWSFGKPKRIEFLVWDIHLKEDFDEHIGDMSDDVIRYEKLHKNAATFESVQAYTETGELFAAWAQRRIAEMRAVKEARMREALPRLQRPMVSRHLAIPRLGGRFEYNVYCGSASTTTLPTNGYDAYGHALLLAAITPSKWARWRARFDPKIRLLPMIYNYSWFVASTLLTLTHGQSASRAQGPPPAPEVLSTTKSGVLLVLPTSTPFTGVDTLEGAIMNPGPVNPGFTGLAGTATSQSNLPAATYRADLPDTMFDPYVGTVIRGSVVAVGTQSGVRFTVNLTNLPDQAQYGPFPYHIHALPVPADGNCTGTLGHLDPTNRGELYMCDASAPETCQVGDLAGKHGGKIMAQGSFMTSFVDPYLSTDPGSAAFLGGLGFVIHTSNTTRLTCANFEMVGGGNMTGNATASMNGTIPTATGAPEFTGVAAKIGTMAGVVVGTLLVCLLAVM
ncbi:Cell surface superoxide dismutase [Cu-Zn] 4 [Kalmusia sp. IMI 367209]|nr:Cell surface superoxide dismutase [Cu-Zn] 4 [Kalmusia sp. IMI 367209]